MEKEGKYRKCKDCNGTGQRVIRRMLGPGMMQQMQTTCNKCSGKGFRISNNDKCKKCYGRGLESDSKIFQFDLDAGTKEGEYKIFEGEGNEAPDCESGDLIIVINQKEDKLFKRKGNNLHYNKDILLGDALLCKNIEMDHISGKKLNININKMIKPDTVVRVLNMGMPIKGSDRSFGDLIINFNIVFPDGIPNKKLLRTILPCTIANNDNDAIKCDGINTTLEKVIEQEEEEEFNERDNDTPGVECATQ